MLSIYFFSRPLPKMVPGTHLVITSSSSFTRTTVKRAVSFEWRAQNVIGTAARPCATVLAVSPVGLRSIHGSAGRCAQPSRAIPICVLISREDCNCWRTKIFRCHSFAGNSWPQNRLMVCTHPNNLMHYLMYKQFSYAVRMQYHSSFDFVRTLTMFYLMAYAHLRTPDFRILNTG